MAADNTVLKARTLTKQYKNTNEPALKGVSFDIKKGELVVILGSSGSGKTTLLNLLGCLDTPSSGEVWIEGKSVSDCNERELTALRRERISFVFQSFNLLDELTALENVRITANTSKNPDIAMEMLELVGLKDKADSYPVRLSGGQQQRVAIARALAKDTEILLCDEPTGALDSENGKQILITLEGLARKLGKTVVIVTHNNEIAKTADRVFFMRSGRIINEERHKEPVPADQIEW